MQRKSQNLRYSIPDNITILTLAQRSRICLTALYSGDASQVLACSRLLNASSTRRSGFHSPCKDSVWPPRARYRPPYCDDRRGGPFDLLVKRGGSDGNVKHDLS